MCLKVFSVGFVVWEGSQLLVALGKQSMAFGFAFRVDGQKTAGYRRK